MSFHLGTLTKFPIRFAKREEQIFAFDFSRYKDKHVSRIVNHYTCCDGYRESSDGRRCEPVCEGESECRQGTCVEPGVCSCDAGFSGRDCSVVGCPVGELTMWAFLLLPHAALSHEI